MKPLLLAFFLLLIHIVSAQSLDYITVRNKNNRTVKNFYAGSLILFQTTAGNYLEGPVKAIRNDSIFITVYDIRYLPTAFGTYVKDTIAIYTPGVHISEIKRIHLKRHRGFFERNAGTLLMIGGAGYLGLNILNGALFNVPITNKRNLRKLGIAGGAFGLGYLFNKLFSSDGFSKKSHQIVYVDL